MKVNGEHSIGNHCACKPVFMGWSGYCGKIKVSYPSASPQTRMFIGQKHYQRISVHLLRWDVVI